MNGKGTKMQGHLKIENLYVAVDDKEILKGINLEIKPGEIVAIMGPNGSGKSTLANTLMGHPAYQVTKGTIFFNGSDITELSSDKRAKLGLFLSFQYPSEVEGVTITNFLRTARNSVKKEQLSVLDFNKLIQEKMELLQVDKKFVHRYLNQGFSGGEKKKAEILQMAVLQPSFAILDETDSGLDVDALKIVADGVNKTKTNEMGVLIITHYNRILDYIIPDKVHVMLHGKIVESGGAELAKELERSGYAKCKEGLTII